MVVFLWWCSCGGVLVVVFLWWCGGVFFWWWCGGVFGGVEVLFFGGVFLVLVFLWWCVCGVLVVVWWIFVVVFL